MLFQQLLLLCLLPLSLGADHYRERPESFRLQEAQFLDKKILVGSVHHDWVLNEEQGPLHVADRALRNKTDDCIAVDVGMNDGFYTQLSAAYGCQVYSFELQESCIALARNATRENNFTDRVNILRAPVTDKHNEAFKVPHGDDNDVKRCDGGFSISGDNPNMKAHKPFQVHGHHILHTVQLDSFFPRGMTIDFLKVDVEGHEPSVLRGAEQLFKSKRIKRAVVEITSYMWGESFHDGIQIFKSIMEYGYNVFCVTEKKRNPDWEVVRRDLNFERFKEIVRACKCIDWEIYLFDELIDAPIK